MYSIIYTLFGFYHILGVAGAEVSKSQTQNLRQLKTSNSSYPKGRVIRDNFITLDEAAQLVAWFNEAESSFFEQNRGALILDSSWHFLGTHHLFKHGNILDGFFKLNIGIKVVRKIRRFVESYFGVSTKIETLMVTSRVLPQDLYPFNGTMWSHGVHVDNCEFDAINHYYFRTCKPNHLAGRHYAAHLYVNECVGADFHFVDYPPPLDEAASEYTKCMKSLKASCYETAGSCCFGQATHTIIKPIPGRLVVFSSGPDNVNGVTPLTRGPRYVLTMWFTVK